LPIADDLPQKPQQRRSDFSVKRIERLRLSAAYPLSQFAVLKQLSSPSCYSGLLPKKFITHRKMPGSKP
jgi:hypothetical protein